MPENVNIFAFLAIFSIYLFSTNKNFANNCARYYFLFRTGKNNNKKKKRKK